MKEFHSYLDLKYSSNNNPNSPKKANNPDNFPSEPSEQQLSLTLSNSIKQLKLASKRYARKQIKHIKSRLCGAGIPVYRLTVPKEAVHNLHIWETLVLKPALDISTALLSGKNPIPPSPHLVENLSSGSENHSSSQEGGKEEATEWKKYTCEGCNRVLNGLHEWTVHQKSRGHKKRRSALAKKAKAAALHLPETSSNGSSLNTSVNAKPYARAQTEVKPPRDSSARHARGASVETAPDPGSLTLTGSSERSRAREGCLSAEPGSAGLESHELGPRRKKARDSH